MHLNGELEPLGFTEVFSIFSNIGAPHITLDESVVTSCTINSKFLYWTLNWSAQDIDGSKAKKIEWKKIKGKEKVHGSTGS